MASTALNSKEGDGAHSRMTLARERIAVSCLDPLCRGPRFRGSPSKTRRLGEFSARGPDPTARPPAIPPLAEAATGINSPRRALEKAFGDRPQLREFDRVAFVLGDLQSTQHLER